MKTIASGEQHTTPELEDGSAEVWKSDTYHRPLPYIIMAEAGESNTPFFCNWEPNINRLTQNFYELTSNSVSKADTCQQQHR